MKWLALPLTFAAGLLAAPAFAFTVPAGNGSFTGVLPELSLAALPSEQPGLLAFTVSLTDVEVRLDLAIDVQAPTAPPFDFDPFEDGYPITFSLESTGGTVLDFPLETAFVSLNLSALNELSDFSARTDLVQSLVFVNLSATATFNVQTANGELSPSELAAFFADAPTIVLKPIFPSAVSVGDPADGFDVSLVYGATFTGLSGHYVVSYEAVPEPSVLTLLGGAGLGLGVILRKRR